MARSNLRTVGIRMSQETIEYFNSTFDASGANSKGEFIIKLLENYNSAPQEPEVKTITVEKELQQNQLLIELHPAQLFALRQHVLSYPDFAEKQNEIIDSMKGDRPYMYFGNLFEPEFQKLWVRNIPITKTMTEDEKENAIRHNMSAFLINMFLMHAIERNLEKSKVNAEMLKTFIRKLAAPVPENNNPKPPQNELHN
jgi:hypothetical protein